MKRILPLLLISIFLASSGWFGWYWYTVGRFIEKTDNAYIRSETTQISAKVAGYVKNIPVEDNAPVAAGDVLARIEPLEFNIRLENGRKHLAERQAALEVARNKSRLQQSRIAAGNAQLSAAEAEQAKRRSDLQRYDALYPAGIVSELDYETVVTAGKKADAETATARANLDSARRELAVLVAEEQRMGAELRQLQEELKLPAQELADTVIRAPIAGKVGNRRVRAGQYIKPGTVLLSVIPGDNFWVDANFKEIQLGRMHEGQTVTIEVDTFPGQLLTGQVESLSPASGAEFSLLPPENAAGNFTKIVQRVPVRIRFTPGQPLLRQLRSGMSVVVKADTRMIPAAGKVSSRKR